MEKKQNNTAPIGWSFSLPRVAAPLLLLTLAGLLFFRPVLFGDYDVPGDTGDSRFNIFILEHLYRWLIGVEPSLVSPQMFYPYPLTLGFSDTHFGTGIFYALLRLIGFDQFDAFKGWYILGNLLTFAAAHFVLLRYVKSPWLAAIGAFAFTFSLPSIVHDGHAQLTYRFAIPFAFLFASLYAELKQPSYFFGLIAAVSLQILINIYLGFFALLISTIIFVVSVAVRQPRSFLKPVTLIQEFFTPFLDRRNYSLPVLGVAIILSALAFAMLMYHGRVSGLYGFIRQWSDMEIMVPRPWSYLMMDLLPYWSPISQALPQVPYRHEHQLFLGIPVTVLFMVAIYYVFAHFRTAPTNLKLQTFVVLTLLVSMTLFGSVSLYWFIGQLPGYNALRGVSRYIIVAAFPVMIAVMVLLEQSDVFGRARRFIPFVFVAWLAFDGAIQHRSLFSARQNREHLATVMENVRHSDFSSNSVLAYKGSEAFPFLVNQIDAMLISQTLGVPTLNGYSGNFVPGYQGESSCMGFARQLKAYDIWARERALPRLSDLNFEVVVVGIEDCDLSQERLAKFAYTKGLAPTVEAATRISLQNPRVEPEGNQFKVFVSLHNESTEILHAMGKNPFRLSWRFPQVTDSVAVGWDPNRAEIGIDIAPGAKQEISFTIDPEGHAITEPMQLTFVVDGKFWAHDIGVMPVDVLLVR